MHNGMTYLDYLFFFKHPVLYIVELGSKSAFITDKYTSTKVKTQSIGNK